jgi:hypothetical protein
MSKTKLRCNTCGKWFQSANAKEQTCPDCLQKARKEKQAAKNAPPTAKPGGPGTSPGAPGSGFQARPAPPPKPKPASSGSNPNRWFDTISDIKVGQPDQPTRPKIPPTPTPRPNRGGPEREWPREPRESGGPGNYREGQRESGGPGNYREGQNRDRGPGGYRGPSNYREGDRERHSPAAYHVSGGIGISGTLGQRPRQPMEGGYPHGPKPGGRPGPGGERPFKPKKPKSSAPKAPPKPKREKQAPPAPFVPTEEQIAQVETRYHELAVPTEYDGIRTQIAQELSIPKKAVKKIIKDLREREEIPSWWEIQTYKGPNEEFEKIKEAYVPLLPLPLVGVHKQIAETLSLKPVDVYQAIKKIRQEMNLPQYNDPALHGIELKPRGKKASGTATQEGEPATETATQEGEPTTPAEASTESETPLIVTVPEEAAAAAVETTTQVGAVEPATEATESAAVETTTQAAVTEASAAELVAESPVQEGASIDTEAVAATADGSAE